MTAEELDEWLAGMKAKANAAAKAAESRMDEERREAKKKANMAYRARLKADPERYEEHKARRRELASRFRARLKADPERYEEYKARRRKPARVKASRIKASMADMEAKARAEHAAFLEERAAYWRSYRAAQRMLAHIFKEEE